MKLATFLQDGVFGAGYLDGDEIVVCAAGDGADRAVLNLIRRGEAGLREWSQLADGEVPRVALSSVQLAAPIPEPRRNIFCVGKNYHAHAAEFHSSGFDSSSKEESPKFPVIFTKATTSVIGPEAQVNASLDTTRTVDYEGELGVILGRRTFQVNAASAMERVYGYTIINDVTSRELQRRHGQWEIGKGIDTFCPMGPWIVTADEVENVHDLELETHVNGEPRQKAHVGDLIFDIPTLIASLSDTMTLLPGDIIATGTPAGVGIGFKPPRYLAPGDVVEVSITGMGRLRNVIT